MALPYCFQHFYRLLSGSIKWLRLEDGINESPSEVSKSSTPKNMLDFEIIDVAYSVFMIWVHSSMGGWSSRIDG
jgi:hypothetical protein